MDTRVSPSTSRFASSRAVWWTFALYPVAFVGAFVVGEGLATLMGYSFDGDEAPPYGVILAAAGPALLVFCLPAILAVVVALRAVRAGNPDARLPMWLSVAITGLFVAQNALAFLLG